MQNDMREACFTLPLIGNDGAPLDQVHAGLEHAIGETFGGFTATDAIGFWTASDGTLYRETVRAYTIAMHDTADHELALEKLARCYGQIAQQRSIYVRFASGRAAILNL